MKYTGTRHTEDGSGLVTEFPAFDETKSYSLIYTEGLYRLFYAVRQGLFCSVAQYVSDDLKSWRKLRDAVRGELGIDSVSAVVRNKKIFLVYVSSATAKCRLAVSKDGETFEKYPLAVIRKGAPCGAKLTYSDGNFYLIGNSAKGVLRAFRSPNCINWESHDIKLEGFDGEAEYPNLIGCKDTCMLYFVRNGAAYSVSGTADLNKGVFAVQGGAEFFDRAFPVRTLMLGPERPLFYAGYGRSLVLREADVCEGGFRMRVPAPQIEARRYIGGLSGAKVEGEGQDIPLPDGDCAVAFRAFSGSSGAVEVRFFGESAGCVTVGADKEKGIAYAACGDTRREIPLAAGEDLRFEAILLVSRTEIYLSDGAVALTLPPVAGKNARFRIVSDGITDADYSIYGI